MNRPHPHAQLLQAGQGFERRAETRVVTVACRCKHDRLLDDETLLELTDQAFDDDIARRQPIKLRRDSQFEALILLQNLGRLRRLQRDTAPRSEEHTSELQSLMRTSYAVFCLHKKKHTITHTQPIHLQ